MPECVDLTAPVRRITPGRGHFFFGYYDVPAADARGRHLCHEVAFRDRFPTPDDVARIGIVPTGDAGAEGDLPFEAFAETRAWNFQQSSMLQWLSSEPDTCLYNVFEGGQFGACVHNVRTGARRVLPRAVANVSRDGAKALCINMPRVFAFRPGYGYEALPDPYADVPAPAQDGVFLMDVGTGACRQILDYPQMVDLLCTEGNDVRGLKFVVNHITFNPSGTRFLFLVRNFPRDGRWPWLTFLLTANADGSDLRNHQCWGMASHYHWRDDEEMLFWLNTCPEGKGALELVNARTSARTRIDDGFFRADGHCSYSPDGRWLLYDSYPDGSTPDHLRALQVYSLDRREGITLGRFRSERLTPEMVDLRCDLHPRWMPDGKSVTFDSIHEGYRGVYQVDLRGIVG